MATYYSSKYDGEEIDLAIDRIYDAQMGNEALQAQLSALVNRLATLEGRSME